MVLRRQCRGDGFLFEIGLSDIRRGLLPRLSQPGWRGVGHASAISGAKRAGRPDRCVRKVPGCAGGYPQCRKFAAEGKCLENISRKFKASRRQARTMLSPGMSSFTLHNKVWIAQA